MEFKEKIKLHQEGKYDLAAELINRSERLKYELSFQFVHKVLETQEYMYYKPIRKINFRDTEDYVSAHIRTLQEKNAKYAYRQINNESFDEMRNVDFAYSYLIKNGINVYLDDFDTIDVYQIEYNEEFEMVFNDILKVLPKVKKDKKKLIEQITPHINTVLNEAMNMVDLNKTDKEIVKFINITLDSRIYRLLNKATGVREFNREGKRYFIAPTNMKLKPRQVDFYKIARIHTLNLSKKQIEFAESLLVLLNKAVAEGNTNGFTFDFQGNITDFNKRYFASLMDIEESNFKKRLKRIQDKYSSWK